MKILKIKEPEYDPFLLSHFCPRETGLPMTVWVSVDDGKNNIHIKVDKTFGNKTIPDDVVFVALKPEIHIINGEINQENFKLVRNWIMLNFKIITDHWEGEIDTGGFVDNMRKII